MIKSNHLIFSIKEKANHFICELMLPILVARDFRIFDPRSSHDPGSGVSVYRFAVNADKTLSIKYSDNKQIMLAQSRKNRRAIRNDIYPNILFSSLLTSSAKMRSSNLYNMAKRYVLSFPESHCKSTLFKSDCITYMSLWINEV